MVQIFTYHSKYIDKTIKTFVEMQTRNNNRKTNCSKSAYSPQIMAEQNRPIALESNWIYFSYNFIVFWTLTMIIIIIIIIITLYAQ